MRPSACTQHGHGMRAESRLGGAGMLVSCATTTHLVHAQGLVRNMLDEVDSWQFSVLGQVEPEPQ